MSETDGLTRGATGKQSLTDRQLARVVRGGAVNLVGAAVSASSGFLLVIVVTNGFSQHTAGLFFSATSVFLVLSSLASLGTDAGLGRFILRYDAHGRRHDILTCLRVAALPVLAVSLLAALVLLVFADAIAPRVGLDLRQGPVILRIFALALPTAALSNFFLAGTRAFGKMRPTASIDKIMRAAGQVALVAVAASAAGGIVALTVSWVFPFAVSMILGAWFLRRTWRSWPARTPSEDVRPRPPRQISREFWRFTSPRALAQVSQIVIQRADIVLIAAMRSPSEAAVYTAATRFIVLGQFGVMAVQQVLQPRFTQLFARGEIAALREVFKTSTSWNMAMAWPLYLVVGCAPGIYLDIFGSGYQSDGAAVVVVMMIAMLFAVFTGPVDTLLLMAGRSTLSLINAVVAVSLNLILCAILIPQWGIMGAAVAWALAISCRCGLAYVQVQHTLRINPLSSGALIIAVSCFVLFGAPLALLDLVGVLSLATFTISVCSSAVLYAITVWVARDALKLRVFQALIPRRSGTN